LGIRDDLRLRYLLVGAALAIALPAEAAEWWAVGIGKDAAMFVDRESVREQVVAGRKVLRAWISMHNSTSERGVKSSKSMMYVDCTEESIGRKSYIDYSATGDVIGSDTFNDYSIVWSPVAPGTLGEAELRFICNWRTGEGGVTKFDIRGNEFVYVDNLETAAAILTPKPAVTPRPKAAPPKAPAGKAPPRKIN